MKMMYPPLDLWQYRLSTTPGRDAVPIGKMWLEVGEKLPVIYISDRDDVAVGILLGFPIDLAGRRIIDRDWQVPARLGADCDAFVREVLLALGGRFLWICDLQGAARIYPDCSAQVPCVYDAQLGVVASTAHAIFDDETYAGRFDDALFHQLGVDGEGWFPAGMTAHHDLNRLLPCHYLDLDQWVIRRFWFGPDTLTDDPSAVVDQIVMIIQAQIEAMISGSKRVAMALTAGHETRMLLACVKPYVNDLDFVTIVGGDRTDTIMAKRIARDLGLSHLTLNRTSATPQQRALFIRRGGHCNADSNSLFHPSVWPIADTHVMVSGAGGEVARAFFWRDSDVYETKLTSSQLADRFGLIRNKVMLSRLDTWIASLAGTNTLTVLDLAYLEHRDGAWYAVQFCSDPTLLRQAPLLTFPSVALMMQLPPTWKKSDRLSREIIVRLWPELEHYPYNSLGKWRDRAMKLERVLKNPKIILKKLRKMRP